MVRLRAACERSDQRGVGSAAIDGGYRSSVVRCQQCSVAVGIKIDFLTAVGIEVESCGPGELFAAIQETVRDGLRLHQRIPQSGAEVRRIESAKDAVPVSVVALAAMKERSGLCAGGAEGFIVAAAAGQTPDFCGNMQHLFVQEI